MRKYRYLPLLLALGFAGLISGTINFSSAAQAVSSYESRTSSNIPFQLSQPAREGLKLHDYLTKFFPEPFNQPRANFIVNDLFDDGLSVDINPGDGICGDAFGACGIRTAVMETNALPGLDTIILGSDTWTLARPGINENAAMTGDLDITDSLIIQGAGAGQTIINGGGIDRVFQVFAAVDFYDLSITGGDVNPGGNGGGINVGCSGNVLLEQVAVYGNQAENAGGIGIVDCGTITSELTISQSSIYQNTAAGGVGGGLDILGDTAVAIINSTISQNESVDGSGIMINDPDSLLTTYHLTLAENHSTGIPGAGLDIVAGEVHLTSSILAYNTAGETSIVADCFGNVISGGANVRTSESCIMGIDDILDTELALGDLTLNAPGTTMTHALLPGASAIDLSSLPCVTTEDQRGAVRPQGPGCDSGAYEAEFVPPTATPTDTPTATPTATATATETATPTDTLTPTATETPTTTATVTATLQTTSTATATIEATAMPTETAVSTVIATPTATDDPGMQLIVNSGFEAEDVAPWVRKNATKDKIKCNQPDKIIAHSGVCVYLFNGSPGENSKLVQKPDLTGLTFAAGDTLDLSLFINAKKASAAGKVKLRVVYGDETPTGKFNADIASGAGYIEITDTYTLTSAAVSLIKIQLQNRSASGKVFIDDVTLVLKSGGESRLLRLPDN